jgi:peptide/nickel transport system substrate-binding protein
VHRTTLARRPASVSVGIVGLLVIGLSAGVQAASAKATPAAATVTWALPPGLTPNYIFPLIPGSLGNNTTVFQWEYLMYRPLYWIGEDGKVAVNERESLAYAPVFSDDDQVVTIRLKSWSWSDGQPITSRDVEFWINELMAEKGNWWSYAPGFFPDDVSSVAYPTSSTVRITFNKSYSPAWILYNNLTQIIPIPQHAWDREGVGSPVGDYDLTPAGAQSVYSFLNAQSSDVGSYTTNPLWKVVDGPWRLTGYDPSTGYSVFSPNTSYQGPRSGNVKKFEEVPFTSDAAEFDAVRSGTLDYGYLPPADTGQASYLKDHGYLISQWPDWGVSYLPLSFTNPQTGPIVQQLYIRQAMQHLINQKQYIKDIFKGFAYPTYGPVPTNPPSQFSGPSQNVDPDPYSVSAASQLLKAHGWTVRANGTSTCAHAGSAAGDCGAGIKQGTPLHLQLLYASGYQALTEEMEALQSSFSQVGINISLHEMAPSSLLSQWSVCTPQSTSECSWQMMDFFYGYTITYEPTFYPSGDVVFANGAVYNGDGYASSEANSLIHQSDAQGGVPALKRYDEYLSKQLPALWMPNAGNQNSVINKNLTGAIPQDPTLEIYPEMWTFK